jgi:hypothetical protein
VFKAKIHSCNQDAQELISQEILLNLERKVSEEKDLQAA